MNARLRSAARTKAPAWENATVRPAALDVVHHIATGRGRHLYPLNGAAENSCASVRIARDSGTGKEWGARVVRANWPLIAVACCAVPGLPMESEPFENEKR